MTITAKFQGILTIPLFDSGLRPAINSVDGGSYLTSFAQAGFNCINHQYRQPTTQRFYEISGLHVESPSGHLLTLNYNAGNLDPGIYDGSWNQGSIFGGLYWTMATSAISDYNGYAAFACIPWNGLFDKTLTSPIILNMYQLAHTPGVFANRGFFAVVNYAFFGGFMNANTATLFNPYINTYSHPYNQLQVRNVVANVNTRVINVPDFDASINYTWSHIGPGTPSFQLCRWGYGTGEGMNLLGVNNVVNGIPDEVVFDDPNIPTQFFGSNNFSYSWNPQGFLVSSSGQLYNNMRSLFITKDGSRYWGINYTTSPAGMLWGFVGSPDDNAPAVSINNQGIVTTNAFYNPNDSNKVYTLTSQAYSIPWNLPQFNPGPTEVILPCFSPCMGKGFELTKI